MQIGAVVREAGPGETVVKPRGVAHAMWHAGDDPVRFFELITPGAFARYFDELEALLGVPGEPDLAALGELAGRYGLAMDVASIPRLMAEHRLAG